VRDARPDSRHACGAPRGEWLSAGITGPESLPSFEKVAFLFHIWIGRLEVIPVLVALRTLFRREGLYA